MSLSSPLLADESTNEHNEFDATQYEENAGTRLDKTIDRIGMGNYQWTLLSLCGFGWMADNLWIQSVSIILPRVQQHFSVPDTYIGALSSSLFAGMMIGAVGWGTCSDLMGRSAAFNGTLFFTSTFGFLSAFSRSFPMLCLSLFLLGTAVGGSMPTDGTLLLENLPSGKEYLVTALSVFFSFGAIGSAILALIILPSHSCPPSAIKCDFSTENRGWQYLLMILATITFAMFAARMIFFRLYESPRFLVHAGRSHEAVQSLQMIAKYNGSGLSLDLHDVDDRLPVSESHALAESPVDLYPPNDDNHSRFQSNITNAFNAQELHLPPSKHNSPERKDYAAASENPNNLDYAYADPTPTISHQLSSVFHEEPDLANNADTNLRSEPQVRPHHVDSGIISTHRTSRSSIYERNRRFGYFLPRWARRSLWGWLDRIQMVLAPEWRRVTLLMWAVWCALSLAFTMFNVYLPKLLETSSVGGAPVSKTLEQALWDIVIYTLGGFPGAIVGAWAIETRLGRRGSLAASTFTTAAFCAMFVLVESVFLVRVATVAISLSATTMWAVLYGWTPEIFGPKVRGTAGGIASALSRIGGMIAPLIGGPLLMVNRAMPVYASAFVFVIAGICVILLDENAGDSGKTASKRTFMH